MKWRTQLNGRAYDFQTYMDAHKFAKMWSGSTPIPV
jgi:hypothetical protein